MRKKPVNSKKSIFLIIFALSIVLFLPDIHAEPSVSIIMDKTTYSYCEKLFYTIEVSEISGEPAIVHIRDETGKGSSAIPIAINNLQNPIPSLVAFEEWTFPLGKYFIDVEYSGVKTTAEFTLVDSNKVCLPETIKPIITNWYTGNISDGFIVDAFKKFVDDEIIMIPFEINQDNVSDIKIPQWVKENTTTWWLQEKISDEELIKVFKYLLDEQIISLEIEGEDEI